MIEDGNRLSMSVRGRKVDVTNNIDGTCFVHDGVSALVCTLEPDIIFTHVQNIQQLVSKNKFKWLGYKPPKSGKVNRGVQVIEGSHFEFIFCVDGKFAELTETSFRGQRNFNVTKLLRAINFIYNATLVDTKALTLKGSIVRKFPDVGILVFYDEEHTCVCRVENINGMCIKHVMVDDVYYADIVCIVDTAETMTINLYDTKGNGLVTYPIDASVKRYFGEFFEEVSADEC